MPSMYEETDFERRRNHGVFVSNVEKRALDREQTTFSWGHDHFSRDHAQHENGCRAPVQRDLQLRNADDDVLDHWGTPSPRGTSIQTKLRDFRD